jgi:hypothetical protein
MKKNDQGVAQALVYLDERAKQTIVVRHQVWRREQTHKGHGNARRRAHPPTRNPQGEHQAAKGQVNEPRSDLLCQSGRVSTKRRSTLLTRQSSLSAPRTRARMPSSL